MKTKLVLSILAIIVSLTFSHYGFGSTSKQTYDTGDKWLAGGSLFTNRLGDQFSVDIRSIPMQNVLKELSRNYGIRFLLPSSLADEEVMVRFTNLKLDEGIKKILDPYDTIFIYRESDHKLREVRIYKGAKEESSINISEIGSTNEKGTEGSGEVKNVVKLKNKRLKEEQKSFSDLPLDLQNSQTHKKVAADKQIGIENKTMNDHVAGNVNDGSSRLASSVEDNLKVTDDLNKNLAENYTGDEDEFENYKDNGHEESEEGDRSEEDEKKNQTGQVEVLCSDFIEDGDNIILPIRVTGNEDETIEAWGLDIDLNGLVYAGWNKSGCLTQESDSFMCNQLSNGCVRCGSYTGKLNIGGENDLFKLELKKSPEAKGASVQLINFVDQLAGAKTSEYNLK